MNQKSTKLEAITKHRIIIDTDTAGDDAAAIAMLAKAPNIIIEGLTVLAGNVPLDQGTKNALMTLEIAGYTDIPVYSGADTTIDGIHRECFSVFGEDGMGDLDLIHPTMTASDGDAIDFILDTVRKYPDEIEILAIGPATNISLAIKREPETMKHVKRIWAMGTSGFGEGNATPVAEFNVYHDIAAYDILIKAEIPLTVIGLDMCKLEDVSYTDEEIDQLAQSSQIGEFLAKSWTGLKNFKKDHTDLGRTDICDAVAAASLIWDNFIAKTIHCDAYLCTQEEAALGQVIFYKENFLYDSMPKIDQYNTIVVTELNADEYKSSVRELLK